MRGYRLIRTFARQYEVSRKFYDHIRHLEAFSTHSHVASKISVSPVESLARKELSKEAAGKWSVHHEVVGLKKTLPEVFEKLKIEVERQHPNSGRLRSAIDSFYFHCISQSKTLPKCFVKDVLEYFEEVLLHPARFVPNETVNQSSLSSVVKIYLTQDNPKAAQEIVEKLYQSNSKVHFRTFGSIIQYYCDKNQPLKALAVWEHLKNSNMEWNSSMEDTLVQLLLTCLPSSENAKESTNKSIPKESTNQVDTVIETLVKDFSICIKELSEDNVSRIKQAFRAKNYGVRVLLNDQSMLPVCTGCGHVLKKEKITLKERELLLKAIETRETRMKNIKSGEFLLPFKEWLELRHQKEQIDSFPNKKHFILDGPNIAYINQNFEEGSFRLDHVEEVVKLLRSQGHAVSITMPFGYLEEKSMLRIRTKKMKQFWREGRVISRTRTAKEKALIDKWLEEGILYSCRSDVLSDDFFWLYGSILLGEKCQVVTNDQGRDHVYTLLKHEGISLPLIEIWKEQTLVNIEMVHKDIEDDVENIQHPIPVEDVRLLPPLPFSRLPQVKYEQQTKGFHFHFPMKNKKWLCIQPFFSSTFST